MTDGRRKRYALHNGWLVVLVHGSESTATAATSSCLVLCAVRKRLRKTLQKTRYVSIARGKEDSFFFHAIMPERSLLGLLINCTTDVGRKKGPLCENCAESPFAFPPWPLSEANCIHDDIQGPSKWLRVAG